MLPKFCLALCLLLLLSCAKTSPRELACDLGRAHGFQEILLNAPPFTLFALLKNGRGKQVSVYLEGDGKAYRTSFEPSNNPSPDYPCALHLALHDPHDNPIVYLARPGQYLDLRAYPCAPRFWTNARMAEDVVHALNQALDQLKAQTKTQRLILVGYSGGGGLAALLAEMRSDVDFLGTVAGNLALDLWVKEKGLSKLQGSLDPYELADTLKGLPQRHWLGENDQIIPRKCALAFCQKAGSTLHICQGLAHRAAWHKVWNYDYPSENL